MLASSRDSFAVTAAAAAGVFPLGLLAAAAEEERRKLEEDDEEGKKERKRSSGEKGKKLS